jgi:hypothetical protein
MSTRNGFGCGGRAKNVEPSRRSPVISRPIPPAHRFEILDAFSYLETRRHSEELAAVTLRHR